MKSYIMLAVRYLQLNKKRSLITVFGVMITVFILYTGLNLTYSVLLQAREAEREKQDYEFVLFTEDMGEIEEILKDARIKSAYVGAYYEVRMETIHPNALYINTTNPYRMNATFTDLKENYGLSGEYNDTLASLYMQGHDGSFVVVIILFTILICYIFAIFGVGIVSNSIQLSMLENIQVYGNLRCIGSSKHQLKRIVFLQGLILEGIGIVAGSVLGTIVCGIVGAVLRKQDIMEINTGFHLLPVLVIVIVFLFDLFFVMRENVKLVTKISPVAAIRGESEIKISYVEKQRWNIVQGVIQKLFGTDGVYAFKNVLRNPRRFGQTVVTLIFGVSAFMGIVAVMHSFVEMEKKKVEEYKYYQIYFENVLENDETIEMVESSLPSVEFLEELSNMEEITEARRMYSAKSYVTSTSVIYQHLSKEFLETYTGEAATSLYESSKKAEDTSFLLSMLRGVVCYGYDDADIEKYKSVLVDGTLDVSPQGVILVNQTSAQNTYEDVVTGMDLYETVNVVYTDYKVGDTIELLDLGELHRRVDVLLEELEEEYYNAVQELEQNSENNTQAFKVLEEEYNQKREMLVAEQERQLAEEGCYKTYIIEGIVSEDVNLAVQYFTDEMLRVIMPLDTYFELTGLDESKPSGMMFHAEGMLLYSKQLERMISEVSQGNMNTNDEAISLADLYCDVSDYMELLQEIKSISGVLLAAFMIVAFILLMFALNTINTTASNLYLRRQEFAQLRVIGVSKWRLMWIIVLEGIIEALIADVIGILLGTGLSYGLIKFINMIIPNYRSEFYFPYGMAIVGVILSVLLLCGSIYFPVRSLGNNLVKGLRAGEN